MPGRPLLLETEVHGQWVSSSLIIISQSVPDITLRVGSAKVVEGVTLQALQVVALGGGCLRGGGGHGLRVVESCCCGGGHVRGCCGGGGIGGGGKVVRELGTGDELRECQLSEKEKRLELLNSYSFYIVEVTQYAVNKVV